MLKDSDKADKLKQSLPPCEYYALTSRGRVVDGGGVGWRRADQVRSAYDCGCAEEEQKGEEGCLRMGWRWRPRGHALTLSF